MPVKSDRSAQSEIVNSLWISLADGMASQAVLNRMDAHGRSEVGIDVSTDEKVDMFIDGITWVSRLERIKTAMFENIVSGGLLVHPGLEARTDENKRDKKIRLAAALRVRFMTVYHCWRLRDCRS